MGPGMAASPTAPGRRERAAREDAMRKRGLSLRLGSLGVFLLFVGGVGTVIWPDSVATLLVVMVVGFVLVLAAFLVIRTVPGGSFGLRELMKSR